MLFRNWLYFFSEAGRNIFKNVWLSLASMGVVAITLLLLGGFILLNTNVTVITEDIKEQVEIVAYLDEDIDENTIKSLENQLTRHPGIKEINFVSRDEAMSRLKEQFGDQSYLLEGYEEEGSNPLRHSFEIKTVVPENVARVAREIEKYRGVSSVDYGSRVVEPLFQFTGVVRWIGAGFMVALAVTATFLIAHTIRLTVFIRRNEIMVMKYVGATDWFIRWPFIIEGLFLGFIGALIPVIGLNYGYQAGVEWVRSHIYFVPLIPPSEAVFNLIKILVPLGTLLGVIGSGVSVRRFLKV